jgi:hypothetical protein
VKFLLVLIVTHELFNPLRSDLFFLLESRTFIVGLDLDLAPVFVGFLDFRSTFSIIMEHLHLFALERLITFLFAVDKLGIDRLVFIP